MGTWNAGLFSNDTTLDVRDTYIEFLKEQLSNEQAYLKTCEEFEELSGTDEEPLFWYALADTQWNVGRLTPEVKEKALKYIETDGGISLWEDYPSKAAKWKKTLQILKEKLESPANPEKRFRKPAEFVTNPWNIGDVYAYQFHSELAEENNLSGKYILFQKVRDDEYSENNKKELHSVIQIFDRVFDSLPTVDVIKKLRLLPLTPYNKTNIYISSFEWTLRVTMARMKKIHYPEKHLTFVGNTEVFDNVNLLKFYDLFFWEKDRMENWIIPFYLSWQNKTY